MKKRLRLLAWVLSLAMLCQMLPFAAFAETDLSTNATDTATTEKSIPDDAIQFNGSHYKFYGIQDVTSNSTATWEAASQFCQNKGGHLAVICSQEENDFLFQQMKSLGYNNALFGFSDKEVEGTWKWVNGTQSSYTNWHYGEPNHQGSYEHYAMFYEKYTDGTWNDGSGIINRNCVFICEWDDSSLVASGVCGDNLTWSLSSDGTLTISGTGDMYDFGYNEHPCPWSKYGNDLSSQITHVIIKDGVTSIGNRAFYQLTNLADVVIPEGITRIGNEAFSMCSILPEITLPSSLSSLGTRAFASCSTLTGIELPSKVTEIPEGAFSGCTSLQYADLPDNLSTISSRAFFECASLSGIVFPDSLIQIGEGAFYTCRSLRTVVIPSNVTEISNFTFAHCEKLTKIILPDTVTAIGSSAFSGCASLETVTLPSKLISLGDSAFSPCSLFFVALPSSLTSIPYDAFGGCHQLKSIYIPLSISSIHQNAFADTELADVYYEGDESQWASLVTAQHSGFDDANIHYNSTNKTTFLFGQDNFSFEHTSNDFFNGSISSPALLSQVELLSSEASSSNHYFISQTDLNHLTKGISARAAKKIKNIACSNWHGSCYGLSLIAMLHYCYPERLPLENLDYISASPTIYHLVKPADSQKNSSFINYYYLTQYLPSVHDLITSRGLECMCQKGTAIKNIVDRIKNGTPVLVSLGDHAVVLLSILSETDSQYVLRVYDPNVFSDGSVNQTPAQMTLFKDSFSNPLFYPYINYGKYSSIQSYIYSTELFEYDCRNYFNVDSLIKDSFDYYYPSLSLPTNSFFTFKNGASFFTIKDGELYDCSSNLKNNLLITSYPDDSMEKSISLFSFDPSYLSSSTELTLSSSVEDGVDLLLNDTLLSISTSGPVKLIYNEAERTVDVTAENPTDVNLLFTQNDTDEAWPWHSWAIDTTGTTKFHAELDDDGLHLSGDGIANAKVGTENMDSEKTDTITLPAKAEGSDALEVTITNKKDSTDNDRLTINGSEPSEPTDPKPDKPSSPSTPAAPSGGSGDGNGSGAGALLLVGAGAAAAAITAGVVLSMPVEVQGKAELADHTALPGAKISLLQDGKVVEQTTADDAGAFSVKVKRGNYQLTAAYTDANGQIIHQTIDIKAPAKDLVVTF